MIPYSKITYRLIKGSIYDSNASDPPIFDIIETWYDGPYKYVSVNGEKASKYLNI